MIIKLAFEKIKQRYYHKKIIALKNQIAPDVIFDSINCFNLNTEYEGGNYIHKGVVFSGSIGYGSYIGADTKLPNTVIGRYCSISWNVQLIAGQHPTKLFVSTHPAFFSNLRQAGFTYVSENIFDEYKFVDNQKRFLLKIGNDVWIGANTTILEGVSIGDGAIIGAGSVVTKDIPPYAIAGGNPAKVIRYRFTEDEIKFLLEYQWWNKDRQWIECHAQLFSDINIFRQGIIGKR